MAMGGPDDAWRCKQPICPYITGLDVTVLLPLLLVQSHESENSSERMALI